MTITQITLEGLFLNPQPDGLSLPAQGFVAAKATGDMVDTTSHTVYVATYDKAELDDTGHVTLEVPATDDTTTTPTGVLYDITVAIKGRLPITFTMALPHTTTTVDLSTLVGI